MLHVAIDGAIDAIIDVIASDLLSDIKKIVDEYAINATAAPPLPLARGWCLPLTT